MEASAEASEAVERVRAAPRAAGHPDTVVAFPGGTRTAADAAAAVGCTVAQIAKSIVFRAGERAAVVVTSGANRVDPARAGAAPRHRPSPMPPFGTDRCAMACGSNGRPRPSCARRRASPWGGGVAPVGHTAPPLLLGEDLLALDPVWAAAGSPRHVFRTSAAEPARMTGARTAAVRAG